MAKATTHYVCQSCGAASPRWAGKCEACGAWNSIVEESAPDTLPKGLSRGRGKKVEFVPLDGQAPVAMRRPTGIAEFDRVTGGGLVRGSAILIGGDPGIGKSTILLQVVSAVAKGERPMRSAYISGVDDRERRIALEVRQAELLIANDREWVKPITDVFGCFDHEWGGWSFRRDRGETTGREARAKDDEWGGCVFRRGFVEYFHLPASIVNRHGEKLARLTPIRELFLRPCNSLNVVALSKKPWLKSVTALYVTAARLNANAVGALIHCPHFVSLKILDVVAGEDVSEEAAKEYYKRFRRHLVRSPHA